MMRIIFICKILILIFLRNEIQGSKTCYCNQAECARTNYLCKSKLNLCFSESFLNNPSSSRSSSSHGCVDNLVGDVDDLCSSGQLVDRRAEGVERRCCAENMCNYRPTGLNDYLKTYQGSEVKDQPVSWASSQGFISFYLIVIIITIAGIFILIVLFSLALHLLKKDDKHLTSNQRPLQFYCSENNLNNRQKCEANYDCQIAAYAQNARLDRPSRDSRPAGGETVISLSCGCVVNETLNAKNWRKPDGIGARDSELGATALVHTAYTNASRQSSLANYTNGFKKKLKDVPVEKYSVHDRLILRLLPSLLKKFFYREKYNSLIQNLSSC